MMKANPQQPARVIELNPYGRGQFTETAWTREWERTMRHRYWVEHGGLFYPRGTPRDLMTNRRDITPPARRLGGG